MQHKERGGVGGGDWSEELSAQVGKLFYSIKGGFHGANFEWRLFDFHGKQETCGEFKKLNVSTLGY